MRTYEMNPLKRRSGWLAAGLAALVLAGCGPDSILDTNTASAQGVPPTGGAPAGGASAGFEYKTKVGTPVVRSGDPSIVAGLVASRNIGSRPDPFALLPQERRFDLAQRAERFQEASGWSVMFEEPVEVTSADDTPEPQPYRRLAGILIGDTVSAILIMENGDAHIIRPGMRIPNSPWRVVSIDEEKAVLRRAGTRKPTQIVIRLETPPGGVPNPGGGLPGGGGRPAGGGEGIEGGPRGGRGPGAVGGADR